MHHLLLYMQVLLSCHGKAHSRSAVLGPGTQVYGCADGPLRRAARFFDQVQRLFVSWGNVSTVALASAWAHAPYVVFMPCRGPCVLSTAVLYRRSQVMMENPRKIMERSTALHWIVMVIRRSSGCAFTPSNHSLAASSETKMVLF